VEIQDCEGRWSPADYEEPPDEIVRILADCILIIADPLAHGRDFLNDDSEADVVQIKNPRSGLYVKIDRLAGKVIAYKESEGPFEGIPIARRARGSEPGS
jgi:hypothetical protein